MCVCMCVCMYWGHVVFTCLFLLFTVNFVKEISILLVFYII